ncbi:DUF4097 family beta strand repeat-containing protein [Thermaerobacillus caldiproteolyticus]|uniref:DUF4097 family beta strand repeat-containing protein n=1 Tax=Thermaerobacillus caldiproteolyticus TaxID=247480 RepID=UPI00188DB830|nr:DUF4097 domain-containing protein [Anoxybacillus caldiproteolyticus]QPA30655.1 DUF4097 domain-containing protein [Anoxybacillus caldiproteolyticus]
MEEKKRILKMVKEGMLTVEEALTLLEQLEEGKKSGDAAFLTTDVQFTDTKQDSVKSSSLKEKLFDFLDTTVKKIKDLDLHFGTAFEVRHIFQQSDASFGAIDVHIANGNVKVVPWDQRDVRIECEAKVYRAESLEAARQSFLREVFFSIENGYCRFSVPKPFMKTKATVYIPETYYDHVKVRLFNGDIHADRLQARQLRAKTVNGSIALHRLIVEEAELETANGSISLLQSTVQDIEAENVHGLIEINGTYKNVHLRTFSGTMICKNEGKEGTIYTKTVTGNTKLFVPADARLEGEIKTNLGSLSYDHTNLVIVEEKHEAAQKGLQFVSKQTEQPLLRVYADSKTGSISLQSIGDDSI